MNIPPRFTQHPSIVQDGTTYIFSCQIQADPPPEVTWFHGNSLLSNNDRYSAKVETDGANSYTLKLTIKNVGPTDSGTYRVEARNAFGQMAANCTLNLQGTG